MRKFDAALTGVFVFALASASLIYTRFDGGAAFLWVATAPLFAHLAVRQYREWTYGCAAAACGSCLASSLFGIGPIGGALLALAIVVEGVIAASLLRAIGDDPIALDDLGSVGRFVAVGGVASPAASGLIGAATIAWCTDHHFWSIWEAWFAAHALGMITFAPLLLLAARGEIRHWLGSASRRCRLEAAVLIGIVAFVSLGVFAQEQRPLLFLPMLPITFAAFRLGRLGAAASIVVLSAIGGILTIQGHGPISLIHASLGARAQFFQFYIATAVTMVLPIAAELKRRESLFLRMQESEVTFRLLAENIGDAIIHTDRDGFVRFVSPAILELTGYHAASVVGRNSRDFVIAEDYLGFETARQKAFSDQGTTVTVEYRAQTRNRGIEWRETRMRSYADENGNPAGLILAVRDVAQRKEAEAELRHEARTDPLTGLPNRRAFFQRLHYLQGEVSSAQGIGCLAILDIDNFKTVNDSWGHSTGDAVLKMIADAARHALRTGDLIARVGGEEFGIVLWGTNIEQATRTCERVRAAIAACCVTLPDGGSVGVTASLGVAAMTAGAASSEAYDNADRALYDAKAGGRDRLQIAA